MHHPDYSSILDYMQIGVYHYGNITKPTTNIKPVIDNWCFNLRGYLE